MQHIYLGKAASLRPDLARSAVPTDPHSRPLCQDRDRQDTTTPAYRQTILEIAPYQPGKPISELQREKGLVDIVKLASNENPLGPSPKAVEALKQSLSSLHIYPDGSCFELRQALADKLGVQDMQLIFGNGSDEVIKMLGLTFLEPGDEVLFCEPTFSEYAYAAHLMGARTRSLPLASYAFDLESVAQAITPNTKIVFICNPNNPTGAYVNQGAVEAFLAKIPDSILVVFDEAYYEYVMAEDYPDTLSYVKAGQNVVVLRTFSKVYGLAGLRIGYGIAPPHIAELIHRVREPFNINALAQIGALAALEDEKHVRESRELNESGKAWLYQELSRLGLEYVPTQTNFIFFNLQQDSQEIYEKLLDQGVIARSGAIFGCANWLRITIGTEAQNRRFVEALEKALHR
ncbi:MAG: histidinol-phosphate transaminase [Firmicutes bacterium]|nr:histidinol-phosphate transaminase [Bacillota bacterium]